MSRVPSVPGVEVGASWLGGCEHALTAGALELLAVLHGTLGPGRAELAASRAVRDSERVGGRCPNSRPGRRTCGRATGGWPRWPRAWSVAGSRSPAPTDRKMIINALNCGAKIFMADFEDSNTPTFDNLVTGQLNVRDASRRRHRRCSSDSAASKMPRERSATSSPPGSGRPRWRRRWRMGEPMPVAHIARVPDAPVQGVPVGRHLADALDVPRHAGLAQHPDGRFDP